MAAPAGTGGRVLASPKARGLIRAFGMSTKTVDGGIAAAEASDAVMVTYNLADQREAAVLDACARLGRGALVKKALASGLRGNVAAARRALGAD